MSEGVDPGVLICLEVIWVGVILYFKTEMEIICDGTIKHLLDNNSNSKNGFIFD